MAKKSKRVCKKDLYYTCKNCGYVHFVVTASYVYTWMREWVEFWIKSNFETRENYGMQKGPPTPDSYCKCFYCGNSYKNFKKTPKKKLIALYGSTIQPILHKDENL